MICLIHIILSFSYPKSAFEIPLMFIGLPEAIGSAADQDSTEDDQQYYEYTKQQASG
jgi:hypothetical protein